jgi:hypothetical protein
MELITFVLCCHYCVLLRRARQEIHTNEIVSHDVISCRQAVEDQAALQVFNSAFRPLAIWTDIRLGKSSVRIKGRTMGWIRGDIDDARTWRAGRLAPPPLAVGGFLIPEQMRFIHGSRDRDCREE